jgi:CheY-like chemotaxis protein
MPYRNILLIDDDEDDQEVFLTVLGSLNPEIKCVALCDAENALFELEEKAVEADIIFLDLNLPGMSGMHFLTEIKGKNSLKEIPVIILTTTSDEKAIRETKELGVSNFLTKPNTYSALREILRTVLTYDHSTNSHS